MPTHHTAGAPIAEAHAQKKLSLPIIVPGYRTKAHDRAASTNGVQMPNAAQWSRLASCCRCDATAPDYRVPEIHRALAASIHPAMARNMLWAEHIAGSEYCTKNTDDRKAKAADRFSAAWPNHVNSSEPNAEPQTDPRPTALNRQHADLVNADHLASSQRPCFAFR